jgi:4-amino-4-deoxy-L-arabinose transferase-like glycosyltransferase
MTWQIPQKIKSILGSLVLAVVLLFIVFWAAIIIQTGQQATKALNYFYQDQNRYPSALEFDDQNTMLSYFTSFPLPEFISASCSKSFDYKRPSDNSYGLSFCLPAANGQFSSGWNTVTGTTPQ